MKGRWSPRWRTDLLPAPTVGVPFLSGGLARLGRSARESLTEMVKELA
jgi:hypothetical protein